MKKPKLIIGLIVLLSALSEIIVFGQTEEKVQFKGYQLVQYKKPILIGENEYEPSFEKLGEFRFQGRIILDKKKKTFTVKWINGDEWVCQYTKVETEKGKEHWFGDVTSTMYIGKWIPQGYDAMLIVSVTKSSGCITSLKSRKVIDKDYGIDTWKKTFTFATGGNCFE